MRCPDCNGGIERSDRFCPHCGRTLKGRLSPPPAVSPPLPNRTPERPASGHPSGSARPSPDLDAIIGQWRKRAGASPGLWRLAIPTLIGAFVASLLLPRGSGLAGAMVGLMVGLSSMKKKN